MGTQLKYTSLFNHLSFQFNKFRPITTVTLGVRAADGGPDQHGEGAGGRPPRGVAPLLQGPPPHARVHLRGDLAPGTLKVKQFSLTLIRTFA